ncbi:MAG: phosphotyrosine protein phosphatase [Lachnospiraceae bacterium]|nr:phosphotyrosine protein phosphatase [Lachnospiraceae bacterium]
MKKYDRLIFLDADDTARAPMAAAVMREQPLLDDLKILSRGLVVLFPEPINPKAEAVLVSHGLTAKEHTAVQLQQAEITPRTLILTMEDNQKEKIWSSYSEAANVYTIAEFAGAKGDLLPLWGEPLPAYGKSLEVIEILVKGLVMKLDEEELSKE